MPNSVQPSAAAALPPEIQQIRRQLEELARKQTRRAAAAQQLQALLHSTNVQRTHLEQAAHSLTQLASRAPQQQRPQITQQATRLLQELTACDRKWEAGLQEFLRALPK